MFSGFKTPQSSPHLSAFFLTLPRLQLYRFANPARENWLWDSLYIQFFSPVCLSPSVIQELPTKVPPTNFRQESFVSLNRSNALVMPTQLLL